MKCPLCAHPETRVLRTADREAGIVRSRQCLRCGHRWPTLELSADQAERLRRLEAAARAVLQPEPEGS